jgi:hypothetical protein
MKVNLSFFPFFILHSLQFCQMIALIIEKVFFLLDNDLFIYEQLQAIIYFVSAN